MTPRIINPFPSEIIQDLQQHTKEIRRCFDWPGIPLHDKNEEPNKRMNRWFWHNLPLLKYLHNSPEFRSLADKIFGEPVKPSYVFLSMYSPEGIVPLHSDRPQCYRTIDLQISSDASWPIYIEDKPYTLKDGEAICYSGTEQPHYRKAMKEDSKATYMNLAFFHFVKIDWQGALD